MHITLIGKDPDSNPTGSPTDAEALAQMSIPEGEACVEIPDRMLQFFER
ncbi:MAG TPA: hypothetical protein VJT31_18615 [Rugosimonospora sp.]|nr:hypothetical protein [Rugosimonospora sp.]